MLGKLINRCTLLVCVFFVENSTTESDVCTTSGCVVAAASFLAAIDFRKNPCDDFFKFACGKWIESHPIPEDKTAIDAFTTVDDSVTQDMLTLLQEKESKYNSRSITIVGQLFKKCMDTETLAALGSSPIHAFVRKLGGWPMLDKNWKERNINWTDLLSTVKAQYGIETFLNSAVGTDTKNVSNNILQVDQGSLGLGAGTRDIYLNQTRYDKQINAYKKKIFNVAHLIADDMKVKGVDDDYLRKSIDKMIEFERRMASITVPEEDRHNYTRAYNKWTLDKLAKAFTFIDWPKFLNRVVPGEVYTRLIQGQTDRFSIIVNEPEFSEKMNKLLSSTPTRDILNYVVWIVIDTVTRYFDTRYEDVNQIFDAVYSGRLQKKPRWKTCVGVAQSMDMAYGAMYVREHFSLQDKTIAISMIKDIKSAFNAILNDLDWMDSSTKNVAIEKVKYVVDKVAFPDFVMNDTALDDYYQNLTWSQNDSSLSYLDLVLKIDKWYRDKSFFDLLRNVDRLKFPVTPAMVNAFYSAEENSITFPAGILHKPFFDGSFPKYVNYGAMGAVIGHEITHGFDDQGSQFDKLGYLKNWWSPTAAQKFGNKTQCMINQYNNYVVPDINMNVNGRLTQSENIADNGGLKQAYLAYQDYVKRNGPEPVLPALNMTNEQAFFVSFSQFWCGIRKPQSQILRILTDPHSPNMFRVNGAASNTPDFARVFQCPPGSPMNPRNKCAVW